MSENGENFDTNTTANVLNPDLVGLQNRLIDKNKQKIQELKDEMNDDIWGVKREDLQQKIDILQSEIESDGEFKDYLKDRDSIDDDGHVHDAVTGEIKSFENANSKDEVMGKTYEESSIDELTTIWAEAEDNNDKTTSISVQDVLNQTVQDVLNQRLIDLVDVNEDLKMRLIDRYHQKMMDKRKNFENSETLEESSVVSDEAEANLEVPEDIEIDTDEEAEGAIKVKKAIGKLALIKNSSYNNDIARRKATERIQSDLAVGGVFKRFLGRVWKGGAGNAYFLQKYTKQELKKIKSDDLSDSEKLENQKIKQDIIDQFTSEYEETIHTLYGEKREFLENDNELSLGIKDLIKKYSQGEFADEESLNEAKNRLLNDYKKNNPDSIIDDETYADNLMEIANSVMGMVENEESIDNVLENLQIIIGEAKSGTRTEEQFNRIDKIVDKLNKTKIGSWVVPQGVISAVTILASVGGFVSTVGTKKSVKIAATMAGGVVAGMGAGAAISGGFAAVHENVRIKTDRANHLRDKAEGKSFDESDKLRKELDATDYSKISAVEASARFESLMDMIDDEGVDKDALFKELLNELVVANVRNELSDTKNIDLISFTDRDSIVAERSQLDISRAKAKIFLEQNFSEQIKELSEVEAGLDADFDLESLISNKSEEITELIQGEISEKDKLFNSIKSKHVAKAAFKAVATSITFGLAFQEVAASLSDSRTGLVEQLWHANNSATDGIERHSVLSALFDGDKSNHEFGTETNSLGTNGNIISSGDCKITNIESNHFDVIDSHGDIIAQNVETTGDGKLTAGAIEQLKGSGITLGSHSDTVEVFKKIASEVSSNDFAANHADEMTNVTRVDFYSNGTPRVYDLNELGLHWGGNGGLAENGNYQLSVSSMTTAGSFSKNGSVDWHAAAAEGKLKILVSVGQGSQSQVFEFPINAEGIADIPSDSPAAALISYENGTASFNGGFIEAVQEVGVNSEGVEEVIPLATVVGENTSSFIDQINSTTYVENITYNLDYNIEKVVEMAPIIPVVTRESLKNAINKNLKVPEINSMYYGNGSLENAKNWISSNPSLLRTRKQIELANGSKAWVEADGLPVERIVEREKDVIGSYLEREQNKNPGHMRVVNEIADFMTPMDDKCRVSINVPAWMEGKNLYQWLEQFSAQVDKNGEKLDPRLYELNVIVNRKTGTEADDSVEVINKFINDQRLNDNQIPNVNYYDIEIDPPNNNVGYARKLITDAVLLRSQKRSNQEGCLYIETEDADVIRADNRTAINLIDKFDNNPHLDAVRGVQDRDPSQLKDNDYLFMRRRAWDFFEGLARQKRFRDPTKPDWNYTWNRVVTGGWNTGYTAEAYADIDGYDSVVAGEDMLIGEKICMIRGDGSVPNIDVIGQVGTRSDSSPRRFIQEIIEGKGAYQDFGNEETNKLIREKTIPELMQTISSHERINDNNKNDFASYLSGISEWSRSTSGGSPIEAEAMARRILFFLGFKKSDYIYKSNGIEIKNWDNFKGYLDRYRYKHEKLTTS